MKIIVIGRGQVGTAMREALAEHDIHHWTQDIDELTSEIISEIKPDAIINAAGKTDLKWCEENPRETVRCNIEAPGLRQVRFGRLRSTWQGGA